MSSESCVKINDKNIVGYRQQVSFEDEYQHNIAIKLARWIGEDATGYVLLCLVVIIISFFMFIQCDYHCLICHSAIIRDIDDPHHEQTISMDDIYEIKGDIKQLNQGDKIYAILCGWNGGYLSEYRLATFEGITNNNKIIIQYKYIQQCVSIERKINIPTSDGSINVPSIIFAESIKPTNHPPPNKKFRGDYNINHNNSNAKSLSFLSFAYLFPLMASFMNIADYVPFKRVCKDVKNKFVVIESMSELHLEKKVMNSSKDYKFYNGKLQRCKQLTYLCVSGEDLGHTKLTIPETVTRLKIISNDCQSINLGLSNPKLKITHLHLVDFGSISYSPFGWWNLDHRLLLNLEYLGLFNCNFDNAYFDIARGFDIRKELPKLRGFYNYNNYNWNKSLLHQAFTFHSLESLGFTDHHGLNISWILKARCKNLKEYHIVAPTDVYKSLLLMIQSPLLQKVHIQNVRRLIKDATRGNHKREDLNQLMLNTFKLPHLNEICITDSCPNDYAIHDSIFYALYDNNKIGKLIKIRFIYSIPLIVALTNSPGNLAIDLTQIYINCERIVKLMVECYGIKNFIVSMEYQCDEESFSELVGLKNIIEAYEKRPNYLKNRLKHCIDDDLCVKVDVESIKRIKFTIYLRDCSVIGNIGHWMLRS